MSKNKFIRSFSTYSFIKKVIVKRYGKVPMVELNDILGAELVQLSIEKTNRETLDAHLSERLFPLVVDVFEPVFTRIFFLQLVAYVDGQRVAGITIKQAIENYLNYCGLDEDDLSLKTATKIYDRYRIDRKNN